VEMDVVIIPGGKNAFVEVEKQAASSPEAASSPWKT